MAKIPFNIKFRPQIESGEYKVETRGGDPIRVLAWDLPYDFPIATAEFTEDNRVIVESYSADGWVGYGEKENNLVVITPESELSEFEKAIKDLVLAIDEGELQELGVFEEENLGAWAIKKAKELLTIAEREIVNRVAKECYKDDFCIEDTVKFNEGYKLGKEVALKNLLRWKKTEKDMKVINKCIVDWNGEIIASNFIPKNTYYISISELEKLPKEVSHE